MAMMPQKMRHMKTMKILSVAILLGVGVGVGVGVKAAR